jgi:hypothetical protein
MYRLYLSVVCCWAVAFAAPEAEKAAQNAALLETVRLQMVQNLMHLPNYTCMQTIERTQKRAPARRFELMDMIRLEVALVSGRELFSWPGAGKFDDKEIYEIVDTGAIGNGSFALHAKSVFQGNPQYKFSGEETVAGRTLLRWDYRVPVLSSGYTIRVGDKQALVGYHGSFWADAKTLDVTRLEVQADDIPLDLHLLQAGSAMDYMRADIGGTSFLLPKSSELRMLDADNTESINQTRFSACHQYQGESKLLFSDPMDAQPSAHHVEETMLPENLLMELKLETPIKYGLTATGDPITFRLMRRLKQDGVTLFEKDALVHGRVTLLRKQLGGYSGFFLGIQLFEIQSPIKHAAFDARIEDGVLPDNAINSGPRSRSELIHDRVVTGALPKAAGSVFFVRGTTLNIMRGTPMNWRTVRDTNDGDKK